MADPTNIENILKKQLTVKYGADEFVFRIPSVKDRLVIAATAAKLRKDSDPDGNGFSLGFDPTSTMLSDRIATFTVLLESTSAKWVYTPGPQGPYIDIDKWSDNVPIMEVIDQFNNELDAFRAEGNRPTE